MAQFKPVGYDGKFDILASINPEKHNGNCYFKVYNNYTKVARISFIKPAEYTEIDGKKEWKIDEIKD